MARLLLVIALTLSVVLPARAAVDSDLVKQGIAAYNDLEYLRATELLQKALQETLTREEKLVTFQTLAFAHVALDKPQAAVIDFENLLRIDGRFELDRTISPRVRAVFEDAKARVATGHGIDGGTDRSLPPVTPEVTPSGRVKEGQTLGVAAAYPGGLAHTVELFYRTTGQTVFSKLTAPVDSAGRFSVTIPGMHVRAPALEYYLVVLDDTSSSVALAGRLGQPLTVEVAGQKRPVYTRAWFWGVIAGVAVVGAGVATAVALTSGGNISASTPATVSIQPH
ncbi:MAG: Tetratricopeptide repeat protein [Myxococcales bacterium]|nr:Tetratricopeptide repeat protein [Myxococcales bacterium]